MGYKKVILIIFVLIAVFISIFQIRSYLVALKKMPVVVLISPSKGNIVNKIAVEGKVEAQDVLRIDAPTSGKIQISKNLKIGSKVSKGEVIIIITPDEESVKSLRDELLEVEESLRLLEKKFNLLQQSYQSAQENKIDEINLERVKRKYELSKKLYELGVVSYQDMETEEINLIREKNSVTKRKEDALAELEIEKLNIIKKENQIKKIKEQLNPKEMIAPFDGIITKISIKSGAIISRGNELITMVNPKDICAALKVSGENISKIKEGQQVIIRKEYYSTDLITGKIEEISMISEESSSEDRGKDYFKVMVKLSQTIGGELINKVIYGEIILKEKNDALKVTFDVIRYEEDGIPYVFLYKDGRARKQKISIGLKSEECVEIIEGVNLQDKIITQENLPLIDGQRVKVRDKDESSGEHL